MRKFFSRAAEMYIDGFRSMTVGKKLWLLIIIKLIIIFAVLKLFFFPDFLGASCDTDTEKAAKVRQEISDESRRY
ncbi:MAG: DUF4492 domain-containing protein [Muribaculaceae bacterium]